ncbi:hypothetical protein E2C01_100100 [Portunus trituberculatus]|uniref:Uncharacterized protein n=1 Tax=Portunus trituberculatus TaxID=210409 RepID=A0A5B7KCF8_PORTR|nr:hypothetical protein [Portunus trituberculatus]
MVQIVVAKIVIGIGITQAVRMDAQVCRDCPGGRISNTGNQILGNVNLQEAIKDTGSNNQICQAYDHHPHFVGKAAPQLGTQLLTRG